jgi:hypothetical protein
MPDHLPPRPAGLARLKWIGSDLVHVIPAVTIRHLIRGSLGFSFLPTQTDE